MAGRLHVDMVCDPLASCLPDNGSEPTDEAFHVSIPPILTESAGNFGIPPDTTANYGWVSGVIHKLSKRTMLAMSGSKAVTMLSKASSPRI